MYNPLVAKKGENVFMDVKNIVARNLTMLRKNKGMTQAELAEQFNYSDKAVSRWEHGDTLPDINVLHQLCEFYGITMNDLVSEECRIEEINHAQEKSVKMYKIWSGVLCASVTWLFATVWFAYSQIAFNQGYWISFIWAIPVSCIIMNYLCRSVFGWVPKFVFSSICIWSTIISMYLHIIIGYSVNLWMIFLIGIPLQVAAFLRLKIKKYKEFI